ncbi:hypothetical protein FDI85_gp005 [Erwinia phage Machina]|uniref:Uncharacterized protein n=2 Tax=Machinavirus machina TaxID=2169990 RepID=A0A1B2IDK8_9CAUD|nr:hypothetical protein BIZ81_gp005 [Erwinia phage vB_EamM_Huxley]YP_009617196.1 hypothetical protein FDI85_gp005 [Erwinia phage Machina]ANZ49360.1 hypothetical protein HUXLEY_278 [Erwinia phage vB_EamM_Huxley]ANZ49917.1 hypothetical protein MACHINA_279 [Erwinia phage Machina]
MHDEPNACPDIPGPFSRIHDAGSGQSQRDSLTLPNAFQVSVRDSDFAFRRDRYRGSPTGDSPLSGRHPIRCHGTYPWSARELSLGCGQIRIRLAADTRTRFSPVYTGEPSDRSVIQILAARKDERGMPPRCEAPGRR